MTCVYSDYSPNLLNSEETATLVISEFKSGRDTIVIDDNSVNLLVLGSPVIIVHLDDVLDFLGVFALFLLGHCIIWFVVIVPVTAQSVNRVDSYKFF